jgi:hypothetical protein
MPRIEVIIGRDGKSKIEVHEGTGGGCALLTNKVRRALGGEVISEQKKPEFYEAAEEDQVRHRD